MNTKGMMTSNSNEWYTPLELFNKIQKELDIVFTLDPCATKESAKCELYYTKEDNGLNKSWRGHNVFINPPYSRDLQPQFIKKAFEESLKDNTKCVLLIPNRSDTKIWHKYILKYSRKIWFIEGRVKFEKLKDGKLVKGDASTFSSVVVLFDGKNSKKEYGVIKC